MRSSRSLYVYVIDEDEQGRAYSLFPLPDLDLENPLPANRTHVLPGTLDGTPRAWEVDTAGGREHLLVLASPERLVDYEAAMNALPRPRSGQVAVPIPDTARSRLRGIGNMVEIPEQAPEGVAGRLFEMATKLADESEVVEGVWVRQIELENPVP